MFSCSLSPLINSSSLRSLSFSLKGYSVPRALSSPWSKPQFTMRSFMLLLKMQSASALAGSTSWLIHHTDTLFSKALTTSSNICGFSVFDFQLMRDLPHCWTVITEEYTERLSRCACMVFLRGWGQEPVHLPVCTSLLPLHRTPTFCEWLEGTSAHFSSQASSCFGTD